MPTDPEAVPRSMAFGLALQNHGTGASREGMDASGEVATRLGWRSVWAVDHMLVSDNEAADYGWTLEALTTLAYLAGRYPRLSMATGILVPPMRDAVQLAKELATLDLLSGGRLVVGVGVGDEEDLGEYVNLGKEERFRRRGAYLDEAIALWRHLWSGRRDPFTGTFHQLTDFVFEPLPPQGADLTIFSGGRSDRALARVGRLTDGYYSSRWGPDELRPRWPAMLASARENGRRRPYLATRVRVRMDAPPDGRYSLCGTPGEMAAELMRFAEIGTDEFVAVLGAVRPDEIVGLAERFDREVIGPFRVAWAAASASVL
jgi:alkanesulfonate monooxygenase SsuD/methylene tetrahydromethanopterin reductase-like flavin-dependent oxidoreductase (luciferase family)